MIICIPLTVMRFPVQITRRRRELSDTYSQMTEMSASPMEMPLKHETLRHRRGSCSKNEVETLMDWTAATGQRFLEAGRRLLRHTLFASSLQLKDAVFVRQKNTPSTTINSSCTCTG